MLRIHLLSLGTEHSHKKTQLGESERDFIEAGSVADPHGQSETDGEAGSRTKPPLMGAAAWRLTTPEDPPSHFTRPQGTMQEIRISFGQGNALPSS